MGTDPYLAFVVGIEAPQGQDDPRFDTQVRAELEELYEGWGDAPVPALWDPRDKGERAFDLVTGHFGWDHRVVERPGLQDVLYEGAPGEGPSESHPVVGYIVEWLGSDVLLRILTLTALGEPLGQHINHLHWEVPQQDPEEHGLLWRRQSHLGPSGQEDVQRAYDEGRWIRYFEPWQTDMWFSVALHVLCYAGWSGVRREDLKMYLVWGWT